jgi:hypothetical protein
MAAPMKAGIAPDLDLTSDYIIQFTALSPTTGAVKGGDLGDSSLFDDPLWISLPADDVNS